MAHHRQGLDKVREDRFAESMRIASLYVLLPDPQTRRRLREAAGLTLSDIADMVGVDHSTVSRYESGARGVGKAHLVTYIDVLRRLAEEIKLRDAIGLEQAHPPTTRGPLKTGPSGRSPRVTAREHQLSAE